MRMMDPTTELGAAMARYRSAFWTVAALSAVLNILLLGGSIYMMMVYDSVLPSHSIPTLIGLFVLITIIYVFQGFFDALRTRILADVGASLDQSLSRRVQGATAEAAARGVRLPGDGLTAMRDLDQIRNFLASSGPSALIDLPWIIFFLGVLTMLHVWLGVTALAGALILIGLTLMTDRATQGPSKRLSQIAAHRNAAAETSLRHVEMLTALGMRGRMLDRWDQVNRAYLAAHDNLTRSVGLLGGVSKIFRLFLQSGILTVGALLVIEGKASGGVIFASSILSGRALAPVDQAIANWRGFVGARLGWTRLTEMLGRVPAPADVSLVLPPPASELEVQQLTSGPPGAQRATIHGIDFSLKAGDALGIVGPSAAGKTSLGRAVIGLWPPLRGGVRLDGAMLDQWDVDTLGGYIGYLPQTVELLDGTVAENIARMEPGATDQSIIAAAKAAGVHHMIVRLPRGYDTPVGHGGSELSAGQRQRIGLARALYKNPFLVLLDEPNSNLDAAGEAALSQAICDIRQRQGIAIVIAHRPSALTQVSHVLVMRDGKMDMFGPRDEILLKITPPAGSIANRSRASARPVEAPDGTPSRRVEAVADGNGDV